MNNQDLIHNQDKHMSLSIDEDNNNLVCKLYDEKKMKFKTGTISLGTGRLKRFKKSVSEYINAAIYLGLIVLAIYAGLRFIAFIEGMVK